MKVPMFFEIIGEPEAGKTDLASRFPLPLLIDTTAKGESIVVFRKYNSDYEKRYVRARTFNDVKQAVEKILKNEEFKTVIIDTSADIQFLAANEWLEDSKQKAVFPVTQYQHVRKKVDDMIDKVITSERNVVFTAGMRDEYTNDKRTGRRTRDGYTKCPAYCDIRLYLKIEELKEPSGKVQFKRTCRVVKNRFVDRTDVKWVENIEPINFESIMKATGLSKEEWVI